jgi:hypothetical protein
VDVAAVACADVTAAEFTPERWKYPTRAVRTKLIGTLYCKGTEPEMALNPLKRKRSTALQNVFDCKRE